MAIVWCFRIITGAFDKTVKLWSTDGKLMHRLEGFLNTITGVCYVPRNKTIWVASGGSNAQLFDPKSGDNVSLFLLVQRLVFQKPKHFSL